MAEKSGCKTATLMALILRAKPHAGVSFSWPIQGWKTLAALSCYSIFIMRMSGVIPEAVGRPPPAIDQRTRGTDLRSCGEALECDQKAPPSRPWQPAFNLTR